MILKHSQPPGPKIRWRCDSEPGWAALLCVDPKDGSIWLRVVPPLRVGLGQLASARLGGERVWLVAGRGSFSNSVWRQLEERRELPDLLVTAEDGGLTRLQPCTNTSKST